MHVSVIHSRLWYPSDRSFLSSVADRNEMSFLLIAFKTCRSIWIMSLPVLSIHAHGHSKNTGNWQFTSVLLVRSVVAKMGARMGAIGPMSALTCLVEVSPITNGSLSYVHDVIYGCGVYCAAAKPSSDNSNGEWPSNERNSRSAVSNRVMIRSTVRFTWSVLPNGKRSSPTRFYLEKLVFFSNYRYIQIWGKFTYKWSDPFSFTIYLIGFFLNNTSPADTQTDEYVENSEHSANNSK